MAAALSCPTCRRPLGAEDVDLATGLARCVPCDRVFSLTDPAPAAVGKPDSVVVVEDGGATVLRWRWFSWGTLFLAVFATAWCAFLVPWWGVGLAGLLSGDPEGLVPLLFGLPHTAVGVGLAYYVVASLLNHTEVRASSSELRVSNGPVPWRGNVAFRSALVSAVRLEAVRGNKGSVSWSIHVTLAEDGDRDKVLLTGLAPTVARYVGQQLSRRLGVPFAADGP